MTFLPNGFLIGKHCNILACDRIIELNNFSDMTYDPVAELWLHLSERAAALLNEEWCQSRRIHPHEWSDTNKVLIVDVSEAMHIQWMDVEDIGARHPEAFHQSDRQTSAATRENTGELAA